MKEIIVITQTQCPTCDSLKMFTKAVFKDKYEGKIKWLNKEDEFEKWSELVEKHSIQSTPTTLVLEDDELIEFQAGFIPQKFKTLIETHAE